MNFTDKIIGFLQTYRPLISFVGLSMFFSAVLFIPTAYMPLKFLLAFLGAVIEFVDFSKVPQGSANRNREIIKAVLISVLLAAVLFLVFSVLPNILWTKVFH